MMKRKCEGHQWLACLLIAPKRLHIVRGGYRRIGLGGYLHQVSDYSFFVDRYVAILSARNFKILHVPAMVAMGGCNSETTCLTMVVN